MLSHGVPHTGLKMAATCFCHFNWMGFNEEDCSLPQTVPSRPQLLPLFQAQQDSQMSKADASERISPTLSAPLSPRGGFIPSQRRGFSQG